MQRIRKILNRIVIPLSHQTINDRLIIDSSTKHSQKQPYEFSKENTLSTRFSISHRFSRRNAVRHHPYFRKWRLEWRKPDFLLATTGMCVFIGMAFYRIPWKDYELAITNNISGVATAIIILLIIGALSGTWMISGWYLPLYIMACRLSIRIFSLLLPALFVHWYQ